MLQIRRSNERGRFDFGWLDTRHTFSFGDYHDPQHMGFRTLRVMNEDRVQPGLGFGMHPHRDMEIVTLILRGALEHRDSLGNGEILRAGELQRMTAGTGIFHSEFNPSMTEPVHLYQIWLRPRERGLTPGYEQRRFDPAQRDGRWQLVATPDARDESLLIHQDATISLGRVRPGEPLTAEIGPERGAWFQVLDGRVQLDDQTLEAGDGISVEQRSAMTFRSTDGAELLWFDLA